MTNKPKVEKPFWQTKEFRELQEKWYDKLSKKGFRDLERPSKKTFCGTSAPFLSPSLSHLRSRLNPSTEDYYRAARAFLYHGTFSSRLHRFIWRLHTQGHSYRKMIPMILKKFDISRSIFWLSTHINKLRSDCFAFNHKSVNGIYHNTSEGLEKFMEANGTSKD